MSAVTTSYCSQYTQRLPQEMVQAAAKSFLFSFTAAALFTGGNVPFACAAGTLASAASLIDSLIRPIMERRRNALQPENDADCLRGAFLKTAIIVALTTLSGPMFGTSVSVAMSVMCSVLGVVENCIGKPLHPLTQLPLRNRAQCYCIA